MRREAAENHLPTHTHGPFARPYSSCPACEFGYTGDERVNCACSSCWDARCIAAIKVAEAAQAWRACYSDWSATGDTHYHVCRHAKESLGRRTCAELLYAALDAYPAKRSS
jgi:hypothetical protein